jgi:hypothetical protein
VRRPSKRHAFDVAGRDAQHIGNGVDRAIRHPAALFLNDFQRFLS